MTVIEEQAQLLTHWYRHDQVIIEDNIKSYTVLKNLYNTLMESLLEILTGIWHINPEVIKKQLQSPDVIYI